MAKSLEFYVKRKCPPCDDYSPTKAAEKDLPRSGELIRIATK